MTAAGALSLAGRACLITGGSRGIGLGTADALLRRGAQVVIASRKKENLEAAATTLAAAHPDGKILTCQAHAGSPEDAQRAVHFTLAELGRLDILVNNAATNPYFGPLMGIEASQMSKTATVNVDSVVRWAQAAWATWMRDNGGAIVNISSIGAFGVDPSIGYYNATKAAVSHLTRQLAFELAPGVRVNSVAPGPVLTEMSAVILEAEEPRLRELLPLGRLGTPADIAASVAFLVSDDASWITGITLCVDGGALALPTGI